jgi:hypothetical protein
VSTSASVTADDGHFRTGTGPLEKASTATIAVSQFDDCTQTLLVLGEGFAVLAPGQFQIDSQLTTASLTATIEIADAVSGASIPLDLSVHWTGVGDTFSSKDRFHQTFPGIKIVKRFDGTGRLAAASGTVSDGTTNFTPEPASFAQLSSLKRGELDISHE